MIMIMRVIRSIPLLILFAAPTAFLAAQTKLLPPITKGGTTLEEFIDLLLTIIQSILLPVVVVCMIYGGYLLVTAGGNETDRSKAKSWIIWSIVGAAIILGAKTIASVIKGTVSAF